MLDPERLEELREKVCREAALPDLIARIKELEAANADLYAQLADRDLHEREQAAMMEEREQAEAKILALQIAITEDVTDAEIGATVKKILAEETSLPTAVTEIKRLRERAKQAEAREAELREALEIVAEGVCPNTECEEVVNRLLSHPRPAILSRLERAEKALREIAALPLESEIKVDEKRVWIEKQTHKAVIIAQQYFEGGGRE